MGLFQAKWTDAIHNEWIGKLLANRPDLSKEQLERTRHLMNTHVPNSLVLHYEGLVPALTLPDPKDRHILAAEIRLGANVIVTYNLKDFPEEVIGEYQIEAQHPDKFLSHLIDLNPWTVCQTVREQRLDLDSPPQSPAQLLATFEKQSLPMTVGHLRKMIELI